MKNGTVLLDKTIYIGASILDLAKSQMYKMHYECIKEIYGDRVILIYTDTGKILKLYNKYTVLSIDISYLV